MARIIQGFRDRLPGRRPLGWAAGGLFFPIAATVRAAESIAVFPESPYERYLIYVSLGLFWLALIGLIVILRMKLREIERTQALGVDREDPDAPLLT